MENQAVSVKCMTFSDGAKIELEKNDLVVLVGPNNAGKSVALRNINQKLVKKNIVTQVVTDLEIEMSGEESTVVSWMESCYRKTHEAGHDFFSGLKSRIREDQVRSNWSRGAKNGLGELAKYFVYYLDTEARLSAANPPGNIQLTTDILQHPIHCLQADDSLERKVSDYFNQAFGKELIVHRNAGSVVPLHCGKLPTFKEGEDRISMRYLHELEKLPLVHEQGDGIRAFVGVLLHSFLLAHTVVLIDEPEAFLHPPQIRLLARMLATETPANRQLFVATHNGDLLRGLLDAGSDRVRIIRLQREGDVNVVSELNKEGVLKLWNDSLLRYSNVLDGLFHSKVIICESDSDCRFYAAIHDALNDASTPVAPKDILFLHCGGKSRLKTAIKALRDLNVPLCAIADFDVFNAEQPLRSIFNELGGDWETIKSDWRLVKTAIEEKKPELNTEEVKGQINVVVASVSETSFPKEAVKKINKILRRSSPWSHAKEVGKSFVPSGDPTLACNRLFQNCKEKGLFIVEVGELEGYARSIPGHGPKWANGALEKNLLADPELESARKFVQEVSAWEPIQLKASSDISRTA